MSHMHQFSGAMAVVLIAAGVARAEIVAGDPVIVPFDGALATIEYLGEEADYTGDLYFLGWGEEIAVIEWATSTDNTGLGQWLANNHNSDIGDTMLLEGTFSAGDVLHFAYNVTEVTDPPDGIATYRTDDRDEGYLHLAWDFETGDFVVEDLPFYESDFDYNDAQFRITFEAIPAPAVLALLGLGGLVSTRRRR
ncbi:MAG: hypothetical protein JSV91_02745 [Phycisphaerales bacterium]|nr:MAG: hypothetical protein JSV91_02745 [Phycisphaerales bacterium]